MQAYTGPDALAIQGRGRGIRYIATFTDLAGGPVPVTGFVIDGGIKDVPDQINNFAGVASRQATFTVSGAVAANLSPYVGTASAKITSRVAVSIQVNGGSTFPQFVGSVTHISVADNGNATVTALDDAALMAGQFSIAAAASLGMYDNSVTPGDGQFSPLAVVNLALRSAGNYLTLPPLISDPATRARTRVLSVPGFGGPLPEVGARDYSAGFEAPYFRVAGKFTPEVIAGNANLFAFGKDLSKVSTFKAFVHEGWVETSNAGGQMLLSINNGQDFRMFLSGSNVQVITWSAGSVPVATGLTFGAGNWHYCYVLITCTTAGLISISVTIDATTTVVQTNLASSVPNIFGVNGGSSPGPNRVALGGNNNIPTQWAAWESVEQYLIPTGDPASIPAARPAAVATASSAGITLTPTRLAYIAPVVDAPQWQTVQDIAQAEGALAFFDELGQFSWIPRKTWLARRAQSPVRTFLDPDLADGMTIDTSHDGLFSSVSIDYRTPNFVGQRNVGQQPLISYVFDPGSDYVDVPANATTTVSLAAPDVVSVGVCTPDQWTHRGTPTIDNFGPDATLGIGGWWAAVKSAAVNDPAAVAVVNLKLTSVPTATGFDLTVYNPNAFAVTFWTPAFTPDSGPAVVAGSGLRIGGFPFTLGAVQTIVRPSNPKAPQALVLDSNLWRQDQAMAFQLASMVAGDVYAPIPDINGVTVPGDPRLQVGDLVSLFKRKLMTAPVLAMVVQFKHNAPVDAAFTSDLQVRPIGAPGVWLVGVTGRSEVGITTKIASY